MPAPKCGTGVTGELAPELTISQRMTDSARVAYGTGLSALLLVFVLGCAKHDDTTNGTQLTLSSGDRVVVIDAHGDSFTNVSGVKRHIFYIGYETALDFENIPALREEAQRVFAAYRPQIAGIDYDSCVVTPMKKTPGGSEEGRPFYLNKNPDGTWTMQP